MQVGAVIVSYEPAEPLLRLVGALREAGIPTEVVDNASSTGREVLDACVAAGASLTQLSTNIGVAGALQHALDATTADWLLTFDQDSAPQEGMVARLVETASAASGDVAIVAPLVQEGARVLQGDPRRHSPYDVRRVITSGALCRVAALRDVGGFRTDLVIDFVDWDVCARLGDAGLRIQVDPGAVLEHTLGRASAHRVPLLGEVTTTNHSPDRQYYKVRNFLLLGRSGELGQDRAWAARTALGLVLGVGKVLAFESTKAAKLSAMGSGLRDGLRGRGGPRHAPRPRPTPAERPRISVCMATYNGARFLRAQLDSILVQLRDTDEVLVQDDGSTDETLEILASYDDPRIVVERNPVNAGVISTFETCLRRARHPMVFLADQDDVWLPGKIDAMLAAFDGPQVTAVVTDAVIVDSEDRLTGESFFAHVNSGPGVIHNFVKNSYLGCCMAVRREVLELALPVPRSVRTHDGWIGITADMLGDVVFIHEPYVKYRRHGGNLSPMSPLGRADVVRRRLALAAHLVRIAPAVLTRRAGGSR